MNQARSSRAALLIIAVNMSLTTLISGFEDAAINIAAYSSARDVLSLHVVNRGWHGALANHDESLFETFLVRDFVEGTKRSRMLQRSIACRINVYTWPFLPDIM